MHRAGWLGGICALALSAGAVPVNLSGTVVDKQGQAVPGAIVRLAAHAGIRDTTNAAGAYTLQGETAGAVHGFTQRDNRRGWQVRNGAVVVGLDAGQETSVERYNLQGRSQNHLVRRTRAGHSQAYTFSGTAHQISFALVRAGAATSWLKIPCLTAGTASMSSPGVQGLAKASALTPPDSLVIAHAWYDTVRRSLDAYTGTLRDSLAFKRLNTGELLRILAPNGGETYTYGTDSMTVSFLVNVDTTLEQVISFSSNSGLSFMDYDGADQTVWHLFPRDTAGTPYRYYKRIPETPGVYLGVYKLRVFDIQTFSGTLEFTGSTMMAKVWDPYGRETGCEVCADGDASDGEFAIVR